MTNSHSLKVQEHLSDTIWCVFSVYAVCARNTHHIVGDGRKHKDGDYAVGDEISKDLGQEVDGRAVIATGVLVTAKNMNKDSVEAH